MTQEELDKALLNAFKTNDTDKIVQLIKEGANVNTNASLDNN